MLLIVLGALLIGFVMAPPPDPKPCDKFASFPSDQMVAVLVAGKCYYGFKQPQQWNDAVARCEGEGTYLVHLQTEEKQCKIYDALGTDMNQHWTGLRYLQGSWRWYYNSTYDVDATGDVTGRWEGAPIGESAYTTTSSNLATLTGETLDAWYKAVCEDPGPVADLVFGAAGRSL